MLEIKKAKRQGTKARVGLVGPSGSGKTYTALRLARGLVGPKGRILVLDTEHGSASKYADDPDIAGEFDVVEPTEYSPQVYIDVLALAAENGYDAVILDSLTHAWSGKGGALEMVDAAAARAKGNSYAGWRNVTPLHNRMIDAIIGADVHVIATMRAKTEYVIETERGKSVPKKVGMAPIQRDGMEYEFDVVGDMDHDHNLVITKTRCKALDGRLFNKPNGEVSRILREWLDGAEAVEQPTVTKPKKAAPPADEPAADNQDEPPDPATILAERKRQLSMICEQMQAPKACVVDYLEQQCGERKFDALDEATQLAVLQDWAAKAEIVRNCKESDIAYISVFQAAMEASDNHLKNIHCATAGKWRMWLEEATEGGTTNG